MKEMKEMKEMMWKYENAQIWEKKAREKADLAAKKLIDKQTGDKECGSRSGIGVKEGKGGL